MQPFKFCLIATALVYSWLYDSKPLWIFLIMSALVVLYGVLFPQSYNGLRRRITMATWSEPSEGNIHAKMTANLTATEEYIEKVKKEYGLKVNVTHMTIKGIGEILKNGPDLNGKIVLGKFIPHDRINVSCLVDIEGQDLASFLIEDVDKMTIEDIAEFVSSKAKEIKSNKGDKEHKKKVGPLKILPSYLITFISEVVQILSVDLGLSFKPMGITKDPFGGAMITSVASLGIHEAWAPFTPFSRVPFIVTLGAPQKAPVVVDDKVVIADTVGLHFTIDHRFIDGSRAGVLQKSISDIFVHPENYSRLSQKKQQ